MASDIDVACSVILQLACCGVALWPSLRPGPSPAGVSFDMLYTYENHPRWRWAQVLLLPAAMEAALRCTAGLRLSQPSLEADSIAAAEEAGGSCANALRYLACCAELQALKAAGQSCEARGLDALPAGQLVRRMTALASTALKVIAVLHSRGQAAGPLDSWLLCALQGCCVLTAFALLDAPEVPASGRGLRWGWACLGLIAACRSNSRRMWCCYACVACWLVACWWRVGLGGRGWGWGAHTWARNSFLCDTC